MKNGSLRKISQIGILVPFLFFQGCAVQKVPLKRPEGVYGSASVEEIKARLMDSCLQRNLIISETGDNHVVCSKELTGMDAFLARLTIGNAYSSTPEQKMRFTVFRIGDAVKVTGHEWVETQMPFGKVNKVELAGEKHAAEMRKLLASLNVQDW